MPELDAGAGTLALVAVAAYLLGSIPFGVLLAKAYGLGDLRKIGSGNIGATNVLRTGNKTAAALTLLLDGAKAAVAILIARPLAGEGAAQVAAMAAFIGHLYPVWLGFRGGKGVATFLGSLLALAWPVGLAACATWLAAAVLSRHSSVGALMAAALSTVWTVVLDRSEFLLLTTLMTILIWWRHRDNIRRIKAGSEPRIGRR